ncbi:MAG: TonB-dependent receptor [Acidobacteria bacterium]|nr:MAG: TonB-dependent receptor [Acidobacteriota bacterium]
MAALSRSLLAFLLVLLLVPATSAQDAATDEQGSSEEAAEPAPEDVIEDVIIVTAGRTEQSAHEVPAAFTVITSEQLETAPADDYGDLLRNVPGLSVSQVSARDIQISSRQATSTLATDQLVMLDGRTIYLDFFGFVMWDFLPVNTREVKQIEVVRGPGSAVWGANAMTGVVNVITKSPREMQGTGLVFGGGEIGTAYASVTHAGAGPKLGYKVSAGYYEQDPYDRPTGIIPGTEAVNPPFGTPYPDFPNSGTEQPKLDLRFDYDSSPSTVWSFSGGFAGTDGIMHTGIGPFDIDSGSFLGYFKTAWTKGSMQASFFANFLDGDAANLLTVGADGRPLLLAFESQTYNLEFSDTKVFKEQHILTYGARVRNNQFDLSIAPAGDDRDEFGVFIQDEILFGDHVRWLIGARFDDIDPVDSVVSPRTSLLISPTPRHTFRVSFNQAYRAPSLINNFLDITIINAAFVDPRLIAAAVAPGIPCEFVLSTCTPFGFFFPSAAIGNPGLDEESLDAFEIGWVGTFANGKATVDLALYKNELTDSIDFFTAQTYDSFSPPPGWPVFLRGTPFPVVPPGVFPSFLSYRNIGEIDNQGVEFSLNLRPRPEWHIFLNYTFQDDPDVRGIARSEVNTPPENRFNLGASYNGPHFFINGNLNFVDDAFWTDVLDARFHGPTDSFTQVNLALGWRFADDRYTITLNGSNIFDEDVQQHVFGDLISRKISADLRINF